MGDLETALTWVAGASVVGGGLGAVGSAMNNTAALPSVENGAGVGVALVTLGGLVVAIANPRAREEGLATAGMGLGALILGAVVSRVVGA
ncbi:MAG: hypothetical protein KGL39_35965 [Patescibacteria group bacterium]|nr:hypothetical protein [Patescibacteria group bacterium]